ncbi:uncharacterized protein LOC117634344 isoform X1 [Prunus dulcis]|uniref:uncharacterized protein LOC117634344 isoform X1 n=1 Tax=Prunus dulcis TaxID=3755 RepID=UPI001482C9A1|nr:uncharacterized protein LOC117634344 isoform X1 [Prunus dulcis]
MISSLPKRSAKSPMARTIRDKPGLHHDLLTRFVISRRPLQTVAYEELRPSTYTKAYNSTAFVLHGFLGSARTWRSFSRTLLSNLSSPSGWRMVLVDLRNRGRSAEIGEQLWVLDSLPGEVNLKNRNKEVERVLHTLQSLPSSVPSRNRWKALLARGRKWITKLLRILLPELQILMHDDVL